jgi:hypothetical protein
MNFMSRNGLEFLKEFYSVIPAPYQVRGKLQRESRRILKNRFLLLAFAGTSLPLRKQGQE